MAVLVEAISVVVRRDAINGRFRGGWARFVDLVPNDTLCSDDQLARVGFMSPADVESFVRHLEMGGLTFVRDGHAVDISVVDQMHGPTIPTEWLEYARVCLGDTRNKVATCWLFTEKRVAAGVHMPAKSMGLATPDGWRYEDSLSANFKFVGNDEFEDKLKYLRTDGDVDVYLDRETGKEVFLSKTADRNHGWN
jgi:hypothetical protein